MSGARSSGSEAYDEMQPNNGRKKRDDILAAIGAAPERKHLPPGGGELLALALAIAQEGDTLSGLLFLGSFVSTQSQSVQL
jgi:hypothetical protein